jgi:acyl-CoA thioesterase I
VDTRYRWDLNPRWAFTHTTFRELHLRPLGHGTVDEPSTAASGTVRKVLAAILITTGVVVLAGLLVWLRWITHRRRYWFERLTRAIPVNSAWWKQRRDAAGNLLYVAIGDSAAQGIGASHPARSYVGVVANYLRAETGREVRVVNLGISGATVRIAIEKELPRLRGLDADVVTVSIGANDIPNFEPSRFEHDIVELFAALPPHAIVADLPSFHFLPSERKVRIANGLLRGAAAAHKLPVAPLHTSTRKQGIWGVTSQFAGDLFHPNDRGYRVWASAFTALVDSRLRAIRAGDRR